MRTRSAEKKSAGKNQIPAGAAEPAPETKRTPPSRAKQARTVGSKSSPAERSFCLLHFTNKLYLIQRNSGLEGVWLEGKASDADEDVQSTPVAKPPSGRKTTRRVVKKVVKKSPASSKTTS
ncbi:hypothetical protein HAX54_010660 [Datura stramonium]|uniref:Uncharacterized protein n=1 Tax=Datura stramonium TaxID=4076 RepID=A0ABS8TGQ0_DATST|nr:hypothetical protein [Datura stramonium]